MKTLNNPFVTFGYAGPDYFCDRAEETKKIVSALENERNLTLLAPRRIGKSGLIKNVFHHLEKRKIARCVYVDLYPTHDVSDFIESFATAVFSTLENGWEKAAKAAATFIKSCRPTVAFDPYLGVPKFSFDLATASAQVTLDEIFKYLDRQQSRIVIALDEFQQVARYPFKGMEALLRAHVQFQTGTRFIFAGSKQRMMDEMFLSANRPFYHSTQIVKIAEIDSAKYYAFAQGFFKAAGSDLPLDVFMNIYRRFSGITWNVQLVLNRLYERKPAVCTTDDVLEIVELLVEEFSDEYARILENYPNNDISILRAIAREGCVREIHASAFTKKHGLPAPSSTATSLTRLLDQQLVYHSDAGYVIYDRLMGIWLAK